MLTPRPKPLRERSNVHHRPMESAASVRDSWTLLAKSTFWQTEGQGPDSQRLCLQSGYMRTTLPLTQWVYIRGVSVLYSWENWVQTEGYSTGVVDAHKHGHAAHHTGPLPLELVWLAQPAVDARVQQADQRWGDKESQHGATQPGSPHKHVTCCIV